jgi:fermentation-respiration switch protein FrsA (DUF1100 family)
LAATEDITSDQIIGREIFIYSGTSANQASQCTAYDSATKIATVSPAWYDDDLATMGYMIVENYTPLTPAPLWDYESVSDQTAAMTPTNWVPMGDSDWGEFILYPAPYRNGAIPWGLKERYYANLLTLDLAGTLMSTLYHKWRNVWVQGVFSKALSDLDDNRATQETGVYWNMLRQMVSREKYGNEISELQCRVGDYD